MPQGMHQAVWQLAVGLLSVKGTISLLAGKYQKCYLCTLSAACVPGNKLCSACCRSGRPGHFVTLRMHATICTDTSAPGQLRAGN